MGRHGTIANRKSAQDSKRSAIFTKYSRQIIVAAKAGGDPDFNPSLRVAIDKAKSIGMPNDNINRAIKKGTGELGGEQYEELQFEGYGPSGVAVIVEALTDNKNRTAGEVRHYFDKFGGKLGVTGSVGFMFSPKGVIVVSEKDEYGDVVVDSDQLMEDALEAGAADFAEEDGYYEIYTEPDDLSAVCEDLEAKGYKFESAEVEKVPATYVTLTSDDDKKFMNLLLENLEENEDIVNVWHNWDEE